MKICRICGKFLFFWQPINVNDYHAHASCYMIELEADLNQMVAIGRIDEDAKKKQLDTAKIYIV